MCRSDMKYHNTIPPLLSTIKGQKKKIFGCMAIAILNIIIPFTILHVSSNERNRIARGQSGLEKVHSLSSLNKIIAVENSIALSHDAFSKHDFLINKIFNEYFKIRRIILQFFLFVKFLDGPAPFFRHYFNNVLRSISCAGLYEKLTGQE